MMNIKNNPGISQFQAGMILGRITQICIDRGTVVSGSMMGLSDLLALLSGELKNLPLSDDLSNQIHDEIRELSESLASYKKEEHLNLDDARVMISLLSRWTDKILDEFTASVPAVPGSS